VVRCLQARRPAVDDIDSEILPLHDPRGKLAGEQASLLGVEDAQTRIVPI
jgi:hypothetical protein